MTQVTTDAEIRTALRKKTSKKISNKPKAFLVDELGLMDARVRIDVALIADEVHGFEIKSSVDSLDRLPHQIEFYRQCLTKLTLVFAPNHTRRVVALSPSWCGLVEVNKGARGGIRFTTLRKPQSNPELDVAKLAHLLWHAEAVALLAERGVPARDLRKPRKALYAAIAQLMTAKEVYDAIGECMLRRRDWRDLQAHA